jgi:hypothetical protein
MRFALAALCLAFGASLALAQATPPDKAAGDSPHSTGRTVSPETKGQQQPQGDTGPTNTTSGGAPAGSPQGQTPPGMQSAPDGSSKTIVDPKVTDSNPVPPATDKSEATRAGTQEPSSKVPGTAKDGKASFDKGTLSAPGAPTDVDTAPAKFSARTSADDAVPIAGYTLRHLTHDQRGAILASVKSDRNAQREPGANEGLATIGGLVPAEIALTKIRPLPESITAEIPELKTVMFTRADEKLVLVNPRTRVVIGVLVP